MTYNTIAEGANYILNASSANEKVTHTHIVASKWFNSELDYKFNSFPPARPGRPDKPELLNPKDMPRRRNAKANAARIAMLHAIAHIELNAIDLAWDIIARFGEKMPIDFINDWIKVADDEARHFELLSKRLTDFDSFYGALPAHDGLWQSAEKTAHNLLARLAIVPLVLEARGLDVTPSLIKKFSDANDQKSVEILELIYIEEIDHVKAGNRWFNYLCTEKKLNPEATYQSLVNKYFAGTLKPPFNIEARNKAGFNQSFYMPISKP